MHLEVQDVVRGPAALGLAGVHEAAGVVLRALVAAGSGAVVSFGDDGVGVFLEGADDGSALAGLLGLADREGADTDCRVWSGTVHGVPVQVWGDLAAPATVGLVAC